ncbi:MAG: DNA recombination protein RmuC, partial [Duncaniella sp.]|nr:DNA recombination protein RmuC [Duncaniella sp.]
MTSIFALLAFIFGGASAYFALLSRRSEQARKTAEQDNFTLRMECEKVKIETTSRIESLNSVLADLKFTNERLSQKLDESSRQTGAVKEENSALTARIEMLQREKEENEKSRAQQEEIFENRFKNLANDILRQNTTDLKTQNEEKLREILQPLHSNIEEFRKTVSETYNNEARERFSLSERIKDLVSLNQAISRQAHELSEALRGDSKVQGDWGEMVLESILEKSGLQKGVEYFIQASTDETGNTLRNEDGTLLRPDVVVRYPDKRYVVIDSKVSLTAFVDYANASDEESRQMASLRHVRSVKKHIDELAKKRYQDYVGDAKLDFVMMFIPTEPAYIAAMRLEPTLWQEAYDKNVLIVSTTQLVS